MSLVPFIRFSLAFGLGVILGGATSASAEEAQTWVLTSLNGSSPDVEVTLTLGSDGTVSGNSGCNRYTGRNNAELPQLALGPMASTRMACPELELEATFLAALMKATEAIEKDGQLVITGDESTQLVFVPAE
ncbi:MAG: META domain-containing protein [Pseudomonadota bacterium]